MIEQSTLDSISQVGFPIVICLYLLYDRFKNDASRCKRDIELASAMKEIAMLINERLPDMKRGE